MMLRRLLSDCHHAILIATEDYPWWMRPFSIAAWWLTICWKIPVLLLYEDLNREDEQRFP